MGSARSSKATNSFETQIASTRWNIKKLLGQGSFGKVYLARDGVINKDVALKVESTSIRNPRLYHEYTVYKSLSGIGIPSVYDYSHFRNVNTLAMEYVGPSLEDVFRKCNRKFTLETVLHLAQDMLSVVEIVHSAGYVHRDIKPENFLISANELNKNKVFLIDMGMCNPIWIKGAHRKFQQVTGLTGSAFFSSLQASLLFDQSRRDDMEALGYIFVRFLKGELPWEISRANCSIDEFLEKIKGIKLTTSIEEMCKGLPAEFETYLKYCRKLNFEETPDYSYCKNILQKMACTSNKENNFTYDWDEELLNVI